MAAGGEDQLSNILHKNDDNDLLKQLELQLEELDDDEFQLPPVGELPTLESILSEHDPGSVSEDDLILATPTPTPKSSSFTTEGCDTLSVHSRGSSESRSRTSSTERHSGGGGGGRGRREPQSRTHGSILRHVILKGVASQLVSAHDRVGAGLPTSMAVGMVICIGTSHGLILVFEPTQALKCCLGSTQLGEQFGAVSALALNPDCTRLLAGFAKGQICLFDLTSSKLLQTIPDAHTPFTAVLHLKWTDYPGMAVISDSGGSVFELSVKRTMGLNSNESRCIFSGSRGEVCTIEPLLMSQFRATPSVDTVILAMATISKVIVVSLRPQLKVLFSHPLKASAATLPVLAWQFVVIQMSDGTRVIDPVLAFGRERSIYFYQLTHGSQEELQFVALQKMSVGFVVQALAWLNTRTLALMDAHERLHVLDVKTQEELERLDLAPLGLVYASPQFKAIATGGNVSKAMALAGERACYHSMVSCGSQVLLLGTKSFQVVTVRSWLDRLDHLVRMGHTQEALQLALDIYQDKAQAIVGLKHRKEKRQQLVQDKIHELLSQYLDSALDSVPERGNLTALTHHYSHLVPLCVKVAVGAGLTEVLFGRIWDTFCEDAISKGIFLESLEPYILSDQLVEMSPSISQCLLSHQEASGRLQAAEACIVHLSVPSLDLHQAMTLCWAHGLYDAIFYVYTRGMGDFVTPLEELVTVLRGALDSSSPALHQGLAPLGNKILVYVSCCLAGRAYPHGEIDPQQLRQVKHEIFKSLTCLHSKNAQPAEPSFPLLRTLLRFDTREFLNVLALAFEEAEFTSELGMQQRQRVVDILIQVMVDDDEFGSPQLGSLFTFIARQMSKQQGAIAINRHLFDQVLCHLTSSDTGSYHDERQTALLELLQGGGMDHYDPEYLLERARKAEFYRVCEYVYEERGELEKIVECYLEDQMRRHQVFTYVRTVLSSAQFTDLHAQKIQDQFVKHIKTLLGIDSSRVASLLLTVQQLMPLLPAITTKLRGDTDTLFTLLQALFTYRWTHTSPGGRGGGGEGSDGTLTPELQEEYIELMCVVQPSQVYAYLKGAEGYRLEQTLEISRRHKQQECTAFLLERAGDVKGAFDILLAILDTRVSDLLSSVAAEDKDSANPLGHVQAQVVKLVRVCQLGSSQLEESGRRELWFPLLDALLSTQPTLTPYQHPAHEMRQMVGHVVNSMMTHISLPAVLERVMQDPGYCDGNFAQIKHLLKGMVERYVYEETLYATVVRILAGDQLRYLTQQHSQARSPLVVRSPSCSLCHSLYHPSSKAVVLSCGHSYHTQCGGESVACVLCVGGGGQRDIATEEPQTSDPTPLPTAGLDETQLEGIRRVRVQGSSGSRLQFLEDLSSPRKGDAASPTSPARILGSVSGSQDIWLSQNFALKLTPPTMDFSDKQGVL